MFDKLFLQDERVLLHHWELLFARFRMVAKAGPATPRFRDVFAFSTMELLTVEADLARFGQAPANQLSEPDAELWRAAAAWVTACREWTSPPAGWAPERVEESLTRRKRLEKAAFAATEHSADECPDCVAPVAVR